MLDEKTIKSLLSKDEVISKIIRDFAMLDDLLSVIMARYFVGKEREGAFVDQIAPRLSFATKLVSNYINKRTYV
jgi:hypothetical protein